MQNSSKFHEVSWLSNMTLRQQHVTHWYPMARLNRLHSESRQEEDSGALWVEHRPRSMSHWPRQHRCGSKTQRRICCNTCSYLFNNSNSTQKYWLSLETLRAWQCMAAQRTTRKVAQKSSCHHPSNQLAIYFSNISNNKQANMWLNEKSMWNLSNKRQATTWLCHFHHGCFCMHLHW